MITGPIFYRVYRGTQVESFSGKFMARAKWRESSEFYIPPELIFQIVTPE